MTRRGDGPEQERFLKGLSMFAREDRQRNTRPVLVHGRRAEANIDVSQLPVREFSRERDSSGNFLFVAGYSVFGGGDVVGP